jgi:hypothetical protein
MPANATARDSGARIPEVLWPLCSLGLVLGLLFLRSLNPNLAVFSNDGPLGQISAQAAYALFNLRGYWQDLNWIGIEQLPGFPTLGNLFFLLLGPVGYSKWVVPFSLLVLGLSAWCCFYRLGFNRWVCLLGAFAAAFDMSVFSNSCWGLPGWTFQRAFAFLALACLADPLKRLFTVRLALAGFCIGMGIMEGFDVGAIFSLYIGALVAFQAWLQKESLGPKLVLASGRVAVMAACAALIAAHALTSLVGTQIKGVAGMQQDAEAKKQRWDDATQWSLPTIEALRIIIPGLFGYRMSDPDGHYYPKSYWGSVAQTPGWEQHRQGLARHTGSGEYAGVLVVLMACWATAQGLRRKGGPFDQNERRLILFWAVAALVSLLLAFGRHAPFYQFVYALPYFSTIRNPLKFLYPMHLALVMLFGYGLQGLWRQYVASLGGAAVPTPEPPVGRHSSSTPPRRDVATTLSPPQEGRGQGEGRSRTGKDAGPAGKPRPSLPAWLKAWWKTAPLWDRRWTIGSVLVVVASLLGWLIYASSKRELVRRLQNIGFADGQLATSMANSSLGEVGLYVLFLTLSVAVVTLILSRYLAGKSSHLTAVALGLVLVTDMVRANVPWIVYYDYEEKYDTNAVIDSLDDRPYEHRVTAVSFPIRGSYFVNDQRSIFPGLCYEWLQHQFPYYRVQSLDVIQRPRELEFDEAYMKALRPSSEGELRLCARLWELTNTRYVLGMTGFLEQLNQQFDPGKGRFRVHTAFNVVPKQGLQAATKLEHLTTAPDPNGPFALFEFTGALPRARLYSRWQISTNDDQTLERLRAPDFDPAQTVLVAEEVAGITPTSATNAASSTVNFASYSPRVIRLDAEASEPSLLLLNDRYHPHWKVSVDGQPARLLRCNYIMRGVSLTPGKHVVEFSFEPPIGPLYVSLVSIVMGAGLCGFLAVASRSRTSHLPTAASGPASVPAIQKAK